MVKEIIADIEIFIIEINLPVWKDRFLQIVGFKQPNSTLFLSTLLEIYVHWKIESWEYFQISDQFNLPQLV